VLHLFEALPGLIPRFSNRYTVASATPSNSAVCLTVKLMRDEVPIPSGFFIRCPDGQFEMFRRLKIRLGHLRWDQIRRSIASEEPIVVKLKLTDARGGPLCAAPPATHIAWEL